MTISIEALRIPYFELLPSISFAKGNILLSWLFWGIFVRWEAVPDDYD